ncbi:lipoyl synthase [Petroclostridium sp. X23]|uniref:lipoyl synthase n=1 Tax=Petroclostridium sp. X23 TaxID=3045146 RepID=UPI0024AC9479|nr:lipoyl synthase [Petroclostridium sp. X23]WHH61737.1 lipoyl synthase [Petroclostridium sp. X23]
MNIRKPEWLKVKSYSGENMDFVQTILNELSLNTVCQEASCPNRMECYNRKTSTFMIMGKICTRNCTFCGVEKAQVQPLDPEEPLHVAQAVKELGLKHVVVTSVTRDDLPDGGAGHFVNVIEKIRDLNEKTVVEVLIPDFDGNVDALSKVIDAKPEIIDHNMETVPRLYATVRPMAQYQRSLDLLENVKQKDNSILTKSGIMVGLGEHEEEVIQVLRDLRKVKCNFLTIGQYLQPSKKHHSIVEYIHPDVFERYKEIGLEMGFDYVESGPLVRSSYHADKAYNTRT